MRPLRGMPPSGRRLLWPPDLRNRHACLACVGTPAAPGIRQQCSNPVARVGSAGNGARGFTGSVSSGRTLKNLYPWSHRGPSEHRVGRRRDPHSADSTRPAEEYRVTEYRDGMESWAGSPQGCRPVHRAVRNHPARRVGQSRTGQPHRGTHRLQRWSLSAHRPATCHLCCDEPPGRRCRPHLFPSAW